MLVKSKFFPQFVKKIEKLKLSLSKHHNKMLKMRSEMLKNRKKGQTAKLGKFYQKNFLNPESRKSQGFLGSRKFLGISRNSQELF